MRVYLDNCCFNRPYDDQTSLKIRLETEAKLDIQQRIKSGQIKLAWSYILDYENSQNPFIERMNEINRWKHEADRYVKETPKILSTMKKTIQCGLKPIDGLHIACAHASECDSFITVDKGILNKRDMLEIIKILNPIDFVFEMENP